jgi:hypothetical protein
MKNIDFLPDLYRQREALRRARVWWCTVVVIFGTAIGLAAGAQLWLRRSIKGQLAELDLQYAAAQAQVRELAALQTQINQAGRAASLFTFLEDPWPRTQILAELVRPLPDSVRLTNLHIGEEVVAQSQLQAQAGPRRRGPRGDDDEGPKLSPPEADLARLREEASQRQTFVELEGQTEDVPQLHQYVAAIGRSPLVAQAQIKSLETTASPDQQEPRTIFTLRVVVRPGYAASGGVTPATPKNQANPAVTRAPQAPQQLARGGEQP